MSYFLDALASLESVIPLMGRVYNFSDQWISNLQPNNLTALQPYRFTPLQPYTLQPYSYTLQPYTLQPCNLTNLYLTNLYLTNLYLTNTSLYLTTLQHYNLTILQPSDNQTKRLPPRINTFNRVETISLPLPNNLNQQVVHSKSHNLYLAELNAH